MESNFISFPPPTVKPAQAARKRLEEKFGNKYFFVDENGNWHTKGENTFVETVGEETKHIPNDEYFAFLDELAKEVVTLKRDGLPVQTRELEHPFEMFLKLREQGIEGLYTFVNGKLFISDELSSTEMKAFAKGLEGRTFDSTLLFKALGKLSKTPPPEVEKALYAINQMHDFLVQADGKPDQYYMKQLLIEERGDKPHAYVTFINDPSNKEYMNEAKNMEIVREYYQSLPNLDYQGILGDIIHFQQTREVKAGHEFVKEIVDDHKTPKTKEFEPSRPPIDIFISELENVNRGLQGVLKGERLDTESLTKILAEAKVANKAGFNLVKASFKGDEARDLLNEFRHTTTPEERMECIKNSTQMIFGSDLQELHFDTRKIDSTVIAFDKEATELVRRHRADFHPLHANIFSVGGLLLGTGLASAHIKGAMENIRNVFLNIKRLKEFKQQLKTNVAESVGEFLSQDALRKGIEEGVDRGVLPSEILDILEKIRAGEILKDSEANIINKALKPLIDKNENDVINIVRGGSGHILNKNLLPAMERNKLFKIFTASVMTEVEKLATAASFTESQRSAMGGDLDRSRDLLEKLRARIQEAEIPWEEKNNLLANLGNVEASISINAGLKHPEQPQNLKQPSPQKRSHGETEQGRAKPDHKTPSVG